MEKKDKKMFQESLQKTKEWAEEGDGRCFLFIAGDDDGSCVSGRYNNVLQLATSIGSVLEDDHELLAAVKIGVAAAEYSIRQKKEKKK